VLHMHECRHHPNDDTFSTPATRIVTLSQRV
jgi:hypothetical protein